MSLPGFTKLPANEFSVKCISVLRTRISGSSPSISQIAMKSRQRGEMCLEKQGYVGVEGNMITGKGHLFCYLRKMHGRSFDFENCVHITLVIITGEEYRLEC
jgi:hypothetical protein